MHGRSALSVSGSCSRGSSTSSATWPRKGSSTVIGSGRCPSSAQGRARLRPRECRRARCRRERPPPLAGHPLRDPPGRGPGNERRPGGHRRPRRARRSPRGRRGRHRPWWRKCRGPPAVQQRDARASGGRREHARGQRDRSRRRRPAARPRRGSPRVDSHGCREGRRAGRRRRARPRRRRREPWPAGRHRPGPARAAAARRAPHPTRPLRQGGLPARAAGSGPGVARPGPSPTSRASCTAPGTTRHICRPRCGRCRRSRLSTAGTPSCRSRRAPSSETPPTLEVGQLLRVRVARGDFGVRTVGVDDE